VIFLSLDLECIGLTLWTALRRKRRDVRGVESEKLEPEPNPKF
jgi:hypothetical protein